MGASILLLLLFFCVCYRSRGKTFKFKTFSVPPSINFTYYLYVSQCSKTMLSLAKTLFIREKKNNFTTFRKREKKGNINANTNDESFGSSGYLFCTIQLSSTILYSSCLWMDCVCMCVCVRGKGKAGSVLYTLTIQSYKMRQPTYFSTFHAYVSYFTFISSGRKN